MRTVLFVMLKFSLSDCSQLTQENNDKVLKELCPKINDCKLDEDTQKKLKDYKKKI